MILRCVRSAVWEAVTSLFGHWSSDYYFSKDRSGAGETVIQEAANGQILLTCGRPLVPEQEDPKGPKGTPTRRAASRIQVKKLISRWRHYRLMKTSSHLRMKALTRRMQALTSETETSLFFCLCFCEKKLWREDLEGDILLVRKRKIVGFRLAR